MSKLTPKERHEIIKEIEHKYKDKKYNRYPPGITYGDISRDMCHSDKRELADISEEIVRKNGE